MVTMCICLRFLVNNQLFHFSQSAKWPDIRTRADRVVSENVRKGFREVRSAGGHYDVLGARHAEDGPAELHCALRTTSHWMFLNGIVFP